MFTGYDLVYLGKTYIVLVLAIWNPSGGRPATADCMKVDIESNQSRLLLMDVHHPISQH